MPNPSNMHWMKLSHFSVERANDAIFWTDSNARFYRVNPAACRQLGYTEEELLAMRVPDVNPDYFLLDWEEIRRKTAANTPITFETRHRRKDGSILPVEISIHFVEFEGREYACSFARDITERRQAADNLTHALAEVEQLRDQLQKENIYLQGEIKSEHNFEEIITQHPRMLALLNRITQVAATSATVLILGETGTGKELLARAVHNHSTRKHRTLVKVNCAALPGNLVESELFGHEKGAFTGAHTQKSGRFELAHGSSIFLDEIGELSLDLQVKLLRVLQESEFERVGGTRTLRVDTRVIAATNRDLETAMTQGLFREDLFYRLNVFPIISPPLRDRLEDIPALVTHFVQKFNRSAGKRIRRVPPGTLQQLKDYHWPGNIRELENLVERAVILSDGPELVLPDPASFQVQRRESSADDLNIPRTERRLIEAALQQAGGVIEGPRGAARMLGIAPSTLRDRLRNHGIHRTPTPHDIRG